MKPIIFNTEMVRAILDGRKTVTRRVIKTIYSDVACIGENGFNHKFIRDDFTDGHYTGFVCKNCGYGVSYPHGKYPVGTSFIRPPYEPGDILYVRETWNGDWCDHYIYKADGGSAVAVGYDKEPKWRPSIHMPKKAARIFLRITNIRIERLQDITSEQIDAEGCKEYAYSVKTGELLPSKPTYFKIIWDNTIKKSDIDRYGWNANPWVWVVEFERISKEAEYEQS